MDLERLPAAIMIVLIAFLLGLGLWYLAVRFNQPKLKTIAMFIAGFPVLGFGLQIMAYVFDWGGPVDTFKTTTPGPARSEASVTRDFPFPVTDHTFVHEVELTPRARAGQTPAAAIHLGMSVRSPKGDMLVARDETLAPAQGQYWSSLRTRFQPPDEGEHTMHLEIPSGVGEVRVKVRQVKK